MKMLQPAPYVITSNIVPCSLALLLHKKICTLTQVALVGFDRVTGMPLFKLNENAECIQSIGKACGKPVDHPINRLAPALSPFEGHATIRGTSPTAGKIYVARVKKSARLPWFALKGG
jgi:hypothetical protein